MRNLVVFGVSLPVLIVSGVVAFGAISQISNENEIIRSYAQPIDAKVAAAVSHAFVSDAALVWPPTEAPVADANGKDTLIVAQAAGIGQTAPFDQSPQADAPVLRNGDSGRDESDTVIVSVTPVIVAEPPTSVPAAKRVAPVKKATARTRSLSAPTGSAKVTKFKMPWQTGVFQ